MQKIRLQEKLYSFSWSKWFRLGHRIYFPDPPCLVILSGWLRQLSPVPSEKKCNSLLEAQKTEQLFRNAVSGSSHYFPPPPQAEVNNREKTALSSIWIVPPTIWGMLVGGKAKGSWKQHASLPLEKLEMLLQSLWEHELKGHFWKYSAPL